VFGFGGRRLSPVAEQLRGDRLGAAPAGQLVDLPVDHPLHDRRLADELEYHGVVLTLQVDDQTAGRDEALPQLLGKADLRDPLEAELRRVPPEHAPSYHDASGGQHQRVRPPAQEATEEPQHGNRGQQQQDVGRPVGRRERNHDGDDPGHDGHGGEERPGEEDPVRAHVDQELLVVVEELPGQRHAPESSCGSHPNDGQGAPGPKRRRQAPLT
jgi:hypothetical protein